ncbi:protein phosphatase 1 regulatory subunit 7 [Pseudohyphozyma bogoriensis]|nr:protein phosphatase 1 regulatory subunit 7 [Pseudohyphozyma bogoriensis]
MALKPTSINLPEGLDGAPSTTSTASAADAAAAGAPPATDDDDDAPATPVSEIEADIDEEPFSNLRDEREFEDKKRREAKLVMGPPLGGPDDTVVDGEQLPGNEEILADLPDETEDLELTHLRLTTLKGLGIERFKNVQRISLRQNLLSSLSYLSTPASTSTGKTLTTTTTDKDGEQEELDEDSHDDEDAKKKEEEFEHHHRHSETSADAVWPLRDLKQLEELDLYDNRIKSVKGLEGLDSITSLDLSFNLIRTIEQLDDPSPDSPYAYPKLDHLYLIQNKLSKMEGVAHRTSLVYLEFGGNRIRTIENLPISANLRSLYLGKNKITKIQNLEGLTGLRTLSIQSNRLTKIEGLATLTELEELYLSHNGLTTLEGLSGNSKLTTLDIGHNKITSVPTEELAHVPLLEEFWANNNLITTLPALPPSTHPNLETIYLEGNPVEKELATAYRRKIMLESPQVNQIDAVYVRRA